MKKVERRQGVDHKGLDKFLLEGMTSDRRYLHLLKNWGRISNKKKLSAW